MGCRVQKKEGLSKVAFRFSTEEFPMPWRVEAVLRYRSFELWGMRVGRVKADLRWRYRIPGLGV